MASAPFGSSSDLLVRLKAGDAAIYDDIIDDCAPDVMRLCYLLLRDADEARDVLQESLVRLVRTVQEGKLRSGNGSIKGFLMTTARNLCLDRLKKWHRFTSIDDQNEQTPFPLIDRISPDRQTDYQRFEDALEKALEHLTTQERAILVLHEISGETNQSIAESLHLSVNAVTTHLCRARRKLRKLLEPYKDLQ